MPADEQFGAIREIQRQGLIRLVGLSEVPVSDIERARRVCDVASVQNRYNVTDREWEAEVDYCERAATAFIPWFPLSAGSLEDGALDRIARLRGATVYQIALAWLLARSRAILVIPGTSSVTHLEENIAAGAITLTEEELTELGTPARR